MKSIPALILEPGRDKPVLRRHPWIFSGSVSQLRGDPGAGETVAVRDHEGQFLAWACYSPESQIRARVMSWTESEPIGPDLFKARLEKSVRDRQLRDFNSDAQRLVHGESDGMPGLIVDRYGDVLVIQILSAGMERWREEIVDLLREIVAPRAIYERSDAAVRSLEGLEERTGPVSGNLPPGDLEIQEGDLQFQVDIRGGHKTGFYLDQRANRALLGSWAAGKDVLDCFSYTGGFALHALQGGAKSVTLVDSSRAALEQAEAHFQINDHPLQVGEFICGDAFGELRKFRDKAQDFDLVVLDPPKFAPTAAQAQQAARGYKDINLWAFKLVRPGGFLLTFSCSGGMERDFFQKVVADAALDAGVGAKIERYLWQDADHPVALNFPEGSYLKGFLIRVAR